MQYATHVIRGSLHAHCDTNSFLQPRPYLPSVMPSSNAGIQFSLGFFVYTFVEVSILRHKFPVDQDW